MILILQQQLELEMCRLSNHTAAQNLNWNLHYGSGHLAQQLRWCLWHLHLRWKDLGLRRYSISHPRVLSPWEAAGNDSQQLVPCHPHRRPGLNSHLPTSPCLCLCYGRHLGDEPVVMWILSISPLLNKSQKHCIHKYSQCVKLGKKWPS